MGPWTRVALVVRGEASGTIHAGRIFGECSDVPADLWTAPNKPLFMLQCGWAGNFRHVAVMRVGDSLVVRVHGIEENGPDAPTVETVGAAVKVPPRAAITLGPPA